MPTENQHIWSEALARALLAGSLKTVPYDLLQICKELGVIHLLVLSGSQVSFMSAFSRMFWAPLLRKTFAVDERIIRIFLALFLVLWVKSFSFPPPLTRALFFELSNLYSKHLKLIYTIPLIVLLQLTFFPEHLSQAGFYLSWMAFLILVFIGHTKLSKFLALTVVTVACTIFFRMLVGLEWPSWNQWILIIVANLTLGFVADLLWFPVLAAFHFFAFLGLSLGFLHETEARKVGVELMATLVAPFLLPFMP